MAHWRGHGPFEKDDVWWKLGRDHWELYHREVVASGRQPKVRRVLEWGCGGGMNAMHFGRNAERYYGVDISQETLDECVRQCQREGITVFSQILVHPDDPGIARDLIEPPIDLFLTTYVFELLPTEKHGLAILQLAADVLCPGGHALIQIRYDNGTISGRSRPWNYKQNLARNVTYRVDDFSALCNSCEFDVLSVVEVSVVPELNDSCYAFFLLERRE